MSGNIIRRRMGHSVWRAWIWIERGSGGLQNVRIQQIFRSPLSHGMAICKKANETSSDIYIFQGRNAIGCKADSNPPPASVNGLGELTALLRHYGSYPQSRRHTAVSTPVPYPLKQLMMMNVSHSHSCTR